MESLIRDHAVDFHHLPPSNFEHLLVRQGHSHDAWARYSVIACLFFLHEFSARARHRLSGQCSSLCFFFLLHLGTSAIETDMNSRTQNVCSQWLVFSYAYYLVAYHWEGHLVRDHCMQAGNPRSEAGLDKDDLQHFTFICSSNSSLLA